MASSTPHSSVKAFLISVSGLVQGVGFRPFVWRLANEMALPGQVWNDAAGVKIQLQCDAWSCKDFIARLQAELPPLAEIQKLDVEVLESATALNSFEIVATQQGSVTTGCAPDAATCPNCLKELFDPQDRRYRYPFINCTDCGPRLSIIQQIPYDREYTTMSGFTQCGSCQAEYDNPADRRFHAQPNACPDCGPQLWLEDNQGQKIDGVDPFVATAEALKAGKIIALKGLGGFHLACDATNAEAVAELRQRKHRPDKAFALMVRDIPALQPYADVTATAEAMLNSAAAPVLLLDPKVNPVQPLAGNIAPGQYQLGFMLPYTPLHHLLFAEIDQPLVMTSGNRSGAPQAINNEDARAQLQGIADLFLMHDRPIQNRVDDSVVRVQTSADREQVEFLRRARGYAPARIALPPGFEQAQELVALGGELKNTLCLLQAGYAIVSQHLGDLEDFQTYEQYQHTLALYKNLYQFESDRYVADKHPEYLSSKFGVELEEQGAELLRVQHHHAHLASCLGDNQYPLQGDPVLGICLDGTGFGDDGTLWGGEFLLGGYQGVERLGHIKPFPLIGGSKAIIEPWRCLYAQLKPALPTEVFLQLSAQLPFLQSPLCVTFDKMVEQGLNAPLTSSAGRLFDAVAALLGCHPQQISYEGQAAIELETLAYSAQSESVKAYPFALTDNQIDPAPSGRRLLRIY